MEPNGATDGRGSCSKAPPPSLRPGFSTEQLPVLGLYAYFCFKWSVCISNLDRLMKENVSVAPNVTFRTPFFIFTVLILQFQIEFVEKTV